MYLFRSGQVNIVHPEIPSEPESQQPDCQHFFVDISQVIRFVVTLFKCIEFQLKVIFKKFKKIIQYKGNFNFEKMWWRLSLSKLFSLCPPSIEVEIYCFTSHRSFVRHKSVLCLCVLSIYHAGGQTRDIDPMPGYCWHTVYDAEPTLAQYWVTVLCLTPRWMWASFTDGGPALTQLLFFDLNRPKSLKNKQNTETRHTGTLECGYPTSFSAD